MKYFFISTENSATHIVTAKNKDNARKIAEKSNVAVKDLYELKADTFKDEGFLISQP